MIVQLFPILCGLTTVCFSACIKRPIQGFFWLLGFGLVLAPARSWSVGDPQEIAVVITVFAFTILQHHAWRRSALFMGGVIAAIWVDSLVALGSNEELALVLVLVLSVTTMVATFRRRVFAGDDMLDEALAGVIVLALLLALVPAVLQGWQAAGSLRALDEERRAVDLDPGVLVLALVAAGLGACYAVYKRRKIV